MKASFRGDAATHLSFNYPPGSVMMFTQLHELLSPEAALVPAFGPRMICTLSRRGPSETTLCAAAVAAPPRVVGLARIDLLWPNARLLRNQEPK
jgi:hypothetical protein